MTTIMAIRDQSQMFKSRNKGHHERTHSRKCPRGLFTREMILKVGDYNLVKESKHSCNKCRIYSSIGVQEQAMMPPLSSVRPTTSFGHLKSHR
jgi:hypothetical protein